MKSFFRTLEPLNDLFQNLKLTTCMWVKSLPFCRAYAIFIFRYTVIKGLVRSTQKSCYIVRRHKILHFKANKGAFFIGETQQSRHICQISLSFCPDCIPIMLINVLHYMTWEVGENYCDYAVKSLIPCSLSVWFDNHDCTVQITVQTQKHTSVLKYHSEKRTTCTD